MNRRDILTPRDNCGIENMPSQAIGISWPKNALHIYSDERYIDDTLVLGALRCTPRRAAILNTKLSQIRCLCDLTAEMKWEKISRTYLPMYKAWAGSFFDDGFGRFLVMRIPKSSPYWQKWHSENRDEEIFRAYYAFLLKVVPPNAPAWVFSDWLTVKNPSRWKTVQYLVNQRRHRDWGSNGRNIRELTPVDSKSCDLIQLTDVLLGAVDSFDRPMIATARKDFARWVALQVEGQKTQRVFRI